MLRALLRLIVIVAVLLALGAFFLGYRWADDGGRSDPAVGTAGRVDPDRARETGAELGETVAEGANRAQRAMSDASLTSKIKAKMALDDRIDAASIDVDTDGSVVTLTGRVRSEAERTRALQLARETDGVTAVVDRLTVGR